jgi:PAS domain S-box-containing protein
MGEFLKRLLDSDFMPHGHCWNWEPWVVWSNALSDSVIFVCYLVIGTALVRLATRRRDGASNPVLVLFGAFIIACGCTHALEVYNTWHGVFRLSGAVKAVTAALSVVTVVPLLRILPQLTAAPSLTSALGMGAALSSEQQAKHRVEGELRESQDRYRHLVQSVDDYFILSLNPQGLVTSWNPGAERITGYSSAEMLGRRCAMVFPTEDLARGKPDQLLRQAAAQGRSEDEGWRVRKDGSRFLTQSVLTAFRDAQGGLQGFACIGRDITEQRAAQAALEDQAHTRLEELRESEARLQGFIRHASAAIACKGLDGRFLLINPRMETLIGREASAILGRTNEDLFPEEVCARVRERDQQVLRLRQDIQVEEHWAREDGAAFDLIVHKFPLVDATGRCWGLGIITTDITESKRADLALLQSQKLESLGVLAGGVAHDFNNLLGAMQGNVELAMTEDSMASARPYLETLRGLMIKTSGLLRMMLAYSGRGQSAMRSLDLNQLVEDMTRLMTLFFSKKARISMELQRDLPAMVGDPAQVQQVVMNLVLNACEALGEQNGVITLSTAREEVSQTAIETAYPGQALHPGPHVALEVADNGSGMTLEVMKKIFDPFFTTKFTGRGLGLAAIHGIVRSHHGAILVSSEPGRGSRFKLLFPAARGPAMAPAAEGPLPPGPAGQDGAGTILVVDDEEDMRSVVVTALTRAGFQTLQASDGRKALELFRRHPREIRLILMDLTMPNLDGEEACRELRRSGATVPVILCSGFNQAEALERFEGLDLAGFLQKPFALGTLVQRVREALDA